jgi:hypothetical protein
VDTTGRTIEDALSDVLTHLYDTGHLAETRPVEPIGSTTSKGTP